MMKKSNLGLLLLISQTAKRRKMETTKTGTTAARTTRVTTISPTVWRKESHLTQQKPQATRQSGPIPIYPRAFFSNPEVKKAMHPAVTGSAFHRIGAAANKEEYPWFHEFGIPADNYATTSGMFRDIQKRFISRESSSEQVPIPEGAFRYVHVNSAEGLMLPIPTSKSKNREDKCIAAVKGGITWATRGDTNAESKTVKALLSELAKSYEKEYVQFGVAKQQADIKEKRKRDKSVSVASKRR
jgi:hypothetical protein